MAKKNTKEVAQDANPKQEKVTLNEFKERLKKLREKRLEQSLDLYLPSLELTVKIAPASAQDFYFELLNTYRNLQTTGEEGGVLPLVNNEGTVFGLTRDQARVLLKACIIEPELDDEAVDALFELPSGEFQMLVGACLALTNSRAIEIAERLGVIDTSELENFFGTTGSGSKE